MHLVQDHINILGINCLVHRSTEYHIEKNEQYFQPRVLQLHLNNINRLRHGKYPNRTYPVPSDRKIPQTTSCETASSSCKVASTSREAGDSEGE